MRTTITGLDATSIPEVNHEFAGNPDIYVHLDTKTGRTQCPMCDEDAINWGDEELGEVA